MPNLDFYDPRIFNSKFDWKFLTWRIVDDYESSSLEKFKWLLSTVRVKGKDWDCAIDYHISYPDVRICFKVHYYFARQELIFS